MALSTTGAVSTTSYDTRTVLDRAYGALGLTPQQITGEKIQIGQDLLSLVLTDLVNTANPLWCLEKVLMTLIEGQRDYVMPIGTNDVNRAFFRTMSNITPATSTSTSAAYTFDFGVNADGSNADTSVGTWAIDWTAAAVPVTFQSSEDNATWTQVGQSGLVSSSGTGTIWYDMKNQLARRYWRVIPTVVVPPNTLSITSARVYNTPNDIMMYRMNKDDYWNMTNKFFGGRPLQYYVQRDLTPVMQLWPQPNTAAAQNVMPVYRQRLIMDVGTLQQAVEVPTRWFYTIIFLLADALAFVTPEAKPDRIQMVQARVKEMRLTTWTEERDKSPVKFQVNLSQYTR
jgi:hypothetical protein